MTLRGLMAAVPETAFQRARREAAEAKAERLRRAAGERFGAARAETAGIPMGQPILVGHHSERKHRRALERHDAKMAQGLELNAAADFAEASARRAGSAILAEDPEALDALRRKLEEVEAEIATRKTANAAWKRGHKVDGVPGAWAAMREAGVSETRIAAATHAMATCRWLKLPFDTTNPNAERRRLVARIATLEAEAAREPAKDLVGDGWRIEEDADACRIRVRFDARTSPELHARMRREGFVFSRREGAYQRQLNEQGRRAAARVAQSLQAEQEPVR